MLFHSVSSSERGLDPTTHTHGHTVIPLWCSDGWKTLSSSGVKDIFPKGRLFISILRLENWQNPNRIKPMLLLAVFKSTHLALKSLVRTFKALLTEWGTVIFHSSSEKTCQCWSGRSSSAATVTAWRDSFGPQSPPAHVACVKMTNLILVENNTGLSLSHRMLYWCSEIDGPMKRAWQATKSARWLDWLELSYSWTLEPIGRFI